MIRSENRTPLFGIMRWGEANVVSLLFANLGRKKRVARTDFYFVIAGLDPAIHAAFSVCSGFPWMPDQVYSRAGHFGPDPVVRQ